MRQQRRGEQVHTDPAQSQLFLPFNVTNRAHHVDGNADTYIPDASHHVLPRSGSGRGKRFNDVPFALEANEE